MITINGNDFWVGMESLGTWVLALFAYRALDQIKVSKEDIDRRDNRDAIDLALKQIEIYIISDFVPLTRKLRKCKEEINFFPKPKKSLTYTIDEISDEKGIVRDEVKNSYTKLLSVPVILGDGTNSADTIIDIANKLEAFSIAFVRNVADNDIGLETTGEMFCRFVEEQSYFYYMHRKNNGVKGYKHTIELYLRWSKEMEKRNLQYEELKIKSQLESLESK